MSDKERSALIAVATAARLLLDNPKDLQRQRFLWDRLDELYEAMPHLAFARQRKSELEGETEPPVCAYCGRGETYCDCTESPPSEVRGEGEGE